MGSKSTTTATIGVDGSDVVSVDLTSFDDVRAILVERTAGDCNSYDVVATHDSTIDGGTPDATLEIDSAATLDPANDPAKLDNGGDGYPFDDMADDGQIHIEITANGGTNGGNEFRIRVFHD